MIIDYILIFNSFFIYSILFFFSSKSFSGFVSSKEYFYLRIIKIYWRFFSINFFPIFSYSLSCLLTLQFFSLFIKFYFILFIHLIFSKLFIMIALISINNLIIFSYFTFWNLVCIKQIMFLFLFWIFVKFYVIMLFSWLRIWESYLVILFEFLFIHF